MDKFTIENMNLYYGKFHALKNVNIRMKKNRITAFIGPSGCGKSTLLKSLNRMNDLVEGCKITGDIRLDNENIYGDMDVNILRKRVGMVFQKANPFPMSITITSLSVLAHTESKARKNLTGLLKNLCVTPQSGMSLKTDSKRALSVFRAVSNKDFVLQEHLP